MYIFQTYGYPPGNDLTYPTNGKLEIHLPNCLWSFRGRVYLYIYIYIWDSLKVKRWKSPTQKPACCSAPRSEGITAAAGGLTAITPFRWKGSHEIWTIQPPGNYISCSSRIPLIFEGCATPIFGRLAGHGFQKIDVHAWRTRKWTDKIAHTPSSHLAGAATASDSDIFMECWGARNFSNNQCSISFLRHSRGNV